LFTIKGLFEHGVIHWKGTNNAITVQSDPTMLLGPAQGGTDRLGLDIVGTTLPAATPAMCGLREFRAADGRSAPVPG
jgi:hypothetical protein